MLGVRIRTAYRWHTVHHLSPIAKRGSAVIVHPDSRSELGVQRRMLTRLWRSAFPTAERLRPTGGFVQTPIRCRPVKTTSTVTSSRTAKQWREIDHLFAKSRLQGACARILQTSQARGSCPMNAFAIPKVQTRPSGPKTHFHDPNLIVGPTRFVRQIPSTENGQLERSMKSRPSTK